MERISAPCIAFRMPKQVVMYWGRNLQWCKQFPRYGDGPKILKVGHMTPSLPILTNFETTPSPSVVRMYESAAFNVKNDNNDDDDDDDEN